LIKYLLGKLSLRGGKVFVIKWQIPDVSPEAEGEKSCSHDKVAQVGKGVDTDQAEDTRQDIESNCYHKEHGRSTGSFENVFALIVSLELQVRILQVLHRNNKQNI